ncbi:DUF4176 domain-containing protein, partial [Lactococcus hodotermopsidis]|uniref:DUF4176 domain-containing protein n=1 Tax=Pseudolactococcus hodotermopsidis TaxID=2709157 RepID=UPI0015561BB2
MSEELSLLPLGTAVKIKNDESAYVIIARIFRKQEDERFLPIYKGVPHPFGE